MTSLVGREKRTAILEMMLSFFANSRKVFDVKRKKKIYIVIVLALIISMIGVVIFLQNKKHKYDYLYVRKSVYLIENYPEIRSKLMHMYGYTFGNDFYEYVDKVSYEYTAINYYFTGNINNNVLKHLEDGLYENYGDTYMLLDRLYYYSYMINKNKTKSSDVILEAVSECVNEMNDVVDKKSLSYLAMSYRLKIVCDNIGIACPIDLQSCNTCDDSYSARIIMSIVKSDDMTLKNIMKELADDYENKVVDIETLIICMSFIPEKYIIDMDGKCMSEAFNYVCTHYYIIPMYLSFNVFRIADYLGIDEEKKIDYFFDDIPKDENGMVPSIAVLEKNCKRAFYNYELHTMFDIDKSMNKMYEWCMETEKRGFRGEDYYYQILLSKVNSGIKVDKSDLKVYADSAAKVNVTPSSFHELYLVAKACIMTDVGCKKLLDNLKAYDNENNYLIIDIMKADLGIASDSVKKDIDKRILDYNDELIIDTYYMYIVYLAGKGKKPSEEICAKIRENVMKFYAENDHGGGFFRNEEFKYTDVELTYEALYVLDAVK